MKNEYKTPAAGEVAAHTGERTQITKIVELTLDGFHGYQTRNVRAVFTRQTRIDDDLNDEGDWDVEITESAARKFACTASDCCCGEGVATTFTCDQYDFDFASITVGGNYSQQ